MADRESVLQKVYEQMSLVCPDVTSVSESTCLVGESALMDSLHLVLFLSALEKDLHTVCDRSLSLGHLATQDPLTSPLRTVGTLVNHVVSHDV